MSDRETERTIRQQLVDSLDAAGLRFGRVARPHPERLEKAAICAFYVERVRRARHVEDLLSIDLAEIRECLRRKGRYRERSVRKSEGALRQALHDITRALSVTWFEIRTNGQLSVDAARATTLDSPLPAASASRRSARAAEPAAAYGTSSVAESAANVRLSAVVDDGGHVRLPAGTQIRSGARVTVVAQRGDVSEPPWAPRPFPVALLRNLVGAISIGGDAVRDSDDLYDQ